MTPDQFKTVERLVFEALEKPAAEREAFLAAVAADEAVLREVRAMLALDGVDAARSTQVMVGIEQLAANAEAVSIETWVGRQVGPYRIDAFLAHGGMGIVFRGHDVRLDRSVAIKVLPEAFARDAERLHRFEREARVVASVTHPHIASVFGLEEAEGRKFLIMELLKGPTLAERLHRGPLPLEEALETGWQIAAALQAAHDAGVVHRDLKPGNIMYADERAVKVLDFGLARSVGGEAPFEGKGMTRTGLAVGTPGYMSPEQARGQAVDRRTDVFAFGCLLFECLTGKAAFCSDSKADAIASLLNLDPDWAMLPPRTPFVVRRLLERCLAKDPARRIRDMGDIRLELEDAARMLAQPPSVATEGAAEPSRAKRRLAAPRSFVAVAAGVAILLAVFAWRSPSAVSPSPTQPTAQADKLMRFTIDFPGNRPQRSLSRIGLSMPRSGGQVVFFAEGDDGVISMWRRRFDVLDLERIPDTEDGLTPVCSPDGEWVAYIAGGVLMKRWLGGAESLRLHEVHGAWGADWSDDDRITFVYTWGQPLAQMSADGGPSTRVTRLIRERSETAHHSPLLLRNGKALLYTVWIGGTGQPRIDVVDLATREQRPIAEHGYSPNLAMTPRGLYLLYVRRSTLFAAPFDEERVAVTGPETAVVDNIAVDGPNARAFYAVADDGTIAYIPGSTYSDDMRLAWADLEKGSGSVPLNDDRLPFADPRFSADGKRLSIVMRRNSYQGFVYDLERRSLERTSSEHDASSGAISPDGRWYAYGSSRDGSYSMWLRDLTTGQERRLVEQGFDFPGFVTWSPDGRWLALCVTVDDRSSRDIWLLDVTGQEPPRPFNPSPYHETGPVFSPNGKLLAYCSAFSSAESLTREVYVSPVPEGGLKRLVSYNGGHSPQWSPDGRILYYRRGGAIMAVELDPETGIPRSQPREVWRGNFGQADPDLTSYAVAPDGRILLVEQSERAYAAEHINVIANWHRLLPAGR